MKKKNEIKQLKYQVEALTHKITLLTGEKEEPLEVPGDLFCVEEEESLTEQIFDYSWAFIHVCSATFLTIIVIGLVLTPIWLPLLFIFGVLPRK